MLNLDSNKKAREKQGVIVGLVGLLLNVFLGLSKLIIGLFSGSVSIMSDAGNNLSDAGSSLVAVFSFVLGGRKADKEHPYGHGRYEYIASLLIGAVIVFVGFQFIITSIGKIFKPQALDFSIVIVVVLALSIAVKLFMGLFYKVKSKKLNSDTIKAASFDSFSDCLVTSGVLISLIVTQFIPFNLDGYVGLVISVIIIVGGIRLISQTINKLLGKRYDKEFANKLVGIVLSDENVVGVHDLKLHDYGPNVVVASIHAEFDKNISIVDAHNVIDGIEHRALEEMGIELVVHCDPIDTDDENVCRIRRIIQDVVRLYENTSIHDLTLIESEKTISFHLRLPYRYLKETDEILQKLKEEIAYAFLGYETAIELDYLYD